MGRLENLQPQLKPGQFKQQGENFIYVADDGAKSQPLSPTLHSFFDLCRGSYSIKEICMVVYNRHKVFSFTEIHAALEQLAAQDMFKDTAAVVSAIKAETEPAKNFAVTRMMSKDDLALHLRKVGLFANLPADTIKAIAEASEQKIVRAGEIVIKRDTLGENAYVLLNGSVGVFTSFYMIGKSRPIAVLRATA